MHKQERVAWNLQQFFVFILFVHSFCRFITIRGYTISSGSLGSTHRLEFSCHFVWGCQTLVSQREWSFHLWYGPVIHQKFYFWALSFAFSCCSPLLAFVLPNLSVYEICINWEHLASQKDSCVLHFCIIYLIAIISSLSEFSISQCPPFKASVSFFTKECIQSYCYFLLQFFYRQYGIEWCHYYCLHARLKLERLAWRMH